MGSLYFRACCSIVADVSLAALCGLLLARAWLRRAPDRVRLPSLVLPSASFVVAVACQLLALIANFTGQSSMPGMMTALPDILTTHPGKVFALTFIAAVVLLVVTIFSSGGRRFRPALTLLFVTCLILRSGSGHSATEDMATLPQALQFFHLAGMAVWSGGVLISGLVVLPRLQGAEGIFHEYLDSLSLSSTWALAVTACAGVGKTWIALEGNMPAALHGGWASLLVMKIVCVGIAILLGLLNRRLLVTQTEWSNSTQARSVTLLRAEAIAMLVILILSGLLANLPPPGE